MELKSVIQFFSYSSVFATLIIAVVYTTKPFDGAHNRKLKWLAGLMGVWVTFLMTFGSVWATSFRDDIQEDEIRALRNKSEEMANKIKSRSLSPEQLMIMRDNLAGILPTTELIFEYVRGDQEAARFAEQLINACKESGFPTCPQARDSISPEIPGIRMVVARQPWRNEDTDRLISALKLAAVQVEIIERGESRNQVIVMVGKKPLP